MGVIRVLKEVGNRPIVAFVDSPDDVLMAHPNGLPFHTKELADYAAAFIKVDTFSVPYLMKTYFPKSRLEKLDVRRKSADGRTEEGSDQDPKRRDEGGNSDRTGEVISQGG